jgi:AraC-like DNA-binding protein
MIMTAMMNMYDTIRENLYFNKFEAGELLFVEYKCPIAEDSRGVWTPMDYFIHVLSGKKTWRTTQGNWTAVKGQTLFIKKGAAIVDQFFKEDFCLMAFFVSDNFIADCVKEISGQLSGGAFVEAPPGPVIGVHQDVTLSAYFQSMLAFFMGTGKPSEPLLRLKLKELIMSILLGSGNSELAGYFLSLARNDKSPLIEVMEANFCYNLALEDFAKLTHRSLSAFKRDFRKYYNESPGKWLLQKRLDYSAVLLRRPGLNVSQIAYDCGFEDLSHFSKAFKDKFGLAPANFRKMAAGTGARNAKKSR